MYNPINGLNNYICLKSTIWLKNKTRTQTFYYTKIVPHNWQSESSRQVSMELFLAISQYLQRTNRAKKEIPKEKKNPQTNNTNKLPGSDVVVDVVGYIICLVAYVSMYQFVICLFFLSWIRNLWSEEMWKGIAWGEKDSDVFFFFFFFRDAIKWF